MKKRSSRLWKVNSDEFKKVFNIANSLSDIARHFKYSTSSSVLKMIKERIEIENLDIEKLKKSRNQFYVQNVKKLHQKAGKKPLDEILVENSTCGNNVHLKNRLFDEGLLELVCCKCGIGPEWNGEPLSLQMDHINGINDDNRIENLRILCPNCHSQTPTFCGKHKKIVNKCSECGKKIHRKSNKCKKCQGLSIKGIKNPSIKVENRPTRIELIELIINKPFTKIGKEYGVSDNAIRKWCKSEKLPYTKNEIESKKEQLLNELNSSVISL